tara:strand:+ start:2688 stop:2861 length:174 start_codon:yes stop_codon:yes gene_type:complete
MMPLLNQGGDGGSNTITLTAVSADDGDNFVEIVERSFGPEDFWPALDSLFGEDIEYI